MTEGYAADWTVEHLREPAQHVADRIDDLMGHAGTRQTRWTSLRDSRDIGSSDCLPVRLSAYCLAPNAPT